MAEEMNTQQAGTPSIGDSLDSIIASATPGGEATPEVTEETQETTPASIEISTETPDELPEDQSKQNQAFASMRKQNSDYQKKLEIAEAYVKKNGFESIEDMLTKQEEEDLVAEAAENKISPEVYNRLKQLEAAELVRQQEFETKRFASRVVEMQDGLSLEAEQLTAFGKIADELGIDLRTTRVPLRQLYLGLNHDALVESKVEAAKQEWLADQDRVKNQSPTTNPRTGTSRQAPNDTVEDIMKRLTDKIR